MKIYLAFQLMPDTTQWKTLRKMQEKERINIKTLLPFYHKAGGTLTHENISSCHWSRK